MVNCINRLVFVMDTRYFIGTKLTSEEGLSTMKLVHG